MDTNVKYKDVKVGTLLLCSANGKLILGKCVCLPDRYPELMDIQLKDDGVIWVFSKIDGKCKAGLYVVEALPELVKIELSLTLVLFDKENILTHPREDGLYLCYNECYQHKLYEYESKYHNFNTNPTGNPMINDSVKFYYDSKLREYMWQKS